MPPAAVYSRPMEVAVAIFNIGAGLGVLAAGLSLAYLAWRATPLIGESRALARDLRELARTADDELKPILEHARTLTTNVEVLSEDVAVKLDRLTGLMSSLEEGVDSGRVTVGAGRSGALPVESWETREGAPDT